MITKIEIENFKSIEKAEVELGKFNVLIGPNNSGKSNFLEAILLMKKLTNYDTGRIFTERDSFEKYLWRDKITANFSFHMAQNSKIPIYQIALSHGEYYWPFVKTEHIESKKDNLILHRSEKRIMVRLISGDPTSSYGAPVSTSTSVLNTMKSSPTILRKAASSEPIRFPQNFIDVADEFNTYQLYKFNPKKFHEPSQIKTDVQIPEIAEDGFGLPSLLMHYVTNDRDLFDEIEETLTNNEQFSFIKRINPTHTEKVLSRLTFKDKSGKVFESGQISDGVLLVLAFITICKSKTPPALIAIEEPENGIHPSNLKLVIDFIRDMVKTNENTQVIITTHSPYLLDCVEPEEVLIFHRDGDGPTQIEQMSKIPHINEMLKGYMLGELWAEYGEEKILKGQEKDED